MRIIVFFDLPVTTAAKRKAANQFRQFLLKDGYQMLQLSVYSRIVKQRSRFVAKTPQQAMCKPTARRVNPLFGSNGKAICHHETTIGRAENPRKKGKFRPTIIILSPIFQTK